MPDPHRVEKNHASKDAAQHDGEYWSAEEVDLLLTWDRSDDELTTMGEILGRTREACRERYYRQFRQPVKTVVTTTKTTTNYYSNWNPEDVSPWYC